MTIVTYAGPSVAAAFVAGVLNDAQTISDAKGVAAGDQFDVARQEIPQAKESLAATQVLAGAAPAQTFDLGLLITRQGELGATDRSALMAGLVDGVQDFLDEFFPGVDDAVALAREGLVEMLRGKPGTDPTSRRPNLADGREVAQLRLAQVKLKRDRDVEQRESEIIAEFAARGFPKPPGELIHALSQKRIEDIHALSDAGWEIDQAEASREKEALERALRMLVDMRARAIQGFASYLARAMSERYDQGLADLEARHRATEQLADLIYQQQEATNRAAALQVKAAESDHGIQRRYLSGLDQLAEQQATAILQKALGLAKMLGAQAATAYNNFRASVSLGSSEDIDQL